jgi:hypothetical protein
VSSAALVALVHAAAHLQRRRRGRVVAEDHDGRIFGLKSVATTLAFA